MSPLRLLLSFQSRLREAVLFVCLSFVSSQTMGELVVEITKGVDDAASIAIVPFSVDQDVPDWGLISIDQIISGDLARSGQFSPLPIEDMLSYPAAPDEIFYHDWRILGVQYLVLGKIVATAEDIFTTHFFLIDIVREQILYRDELLGSAEEVRSMAHYISDKVYEEVTGIDGAYSTKLLYISASDVATGKPNYRLTMADVDGAQQDVIYESVEPLLSPSWSPDGKRVAYVSFEGGNGSVIVHDLLSGKRQQVVAFNGEGRSSAPSFSPDASKLALVLSRRGNPDIYLKDLITGELSQITKHYKIDTEPSWAPDGETMTFTSDRSGSPQIFLLTLATKKVRRLTFKGKYNARSQILPDGENIVFVHRKEGVFHIALMNIEHGRMRILTKTELDESPSISPNGVMMIYATQDLGKGILAVMSLDGKVKYNLPDTAGNEIREPSWSPFFVVTEFVDSEIVELPPTVQ